MARYKITHIKGVVITPHPFDVYEVKLVCVPRRDNGETMAHQYLKAKYGQGKSPPYGDLGIGGSL